MNGVSLEPRGTLSGLKETNHSLQFCYTKAKTCELRSYGDFGGGEAGEVPARPRTLALTVFPGLQPSPKGPP